MRTRVTHTVVYPSQPPLLLVVFLTLIRVPSDPRPLGFFFSSTGCQIDGDSF